jgi:hypothetical protein
MPKMLKLSQGRRVANYVEDGTNETYTAPRVAGGPYHGSKRRRSGSEI